MITQAPCCRQNATVSPAHAATETLSHSAGSSRRSRTARSGWALAGCLTSLTATSKVIHRYGTDRAQFGELWLPDGAAAGTVVVIHGGFWRARYDLSLGRPLASD